MTFVFGFLFLCYGETRRREGEGMVRWVSYMRKRNGSQEPTPSFLHFSHRRPQVHTLCLQTSFIHCIGPSLVQTQSYHTPSANSLWISTACPSCSRIEIQLDSLSSQHLREKDPPPYLSALLALPPEPDHTCQLPHLVVRLLHALLYDLGDFWSSFISVSYVGLSLFTFP